MQDLLGKPQLRYIMGNYHGAIIMWFWMVIVMVARAELKCKYM